MLVERSNFINSSNLKPKTNKNIKGMNVIPQSRGNLKCNVLW